MAWYKVNRRFLDTDTKVIYELGVYIDAKPGWAERFGKKLERTNKPVPKERADGSVLKPRVQRVIYPRKPVPKVEEVRPIPPQPKVAPDVDAETEALVEEEAEVEPSRQPRGKK